MHMQGSGSYTCNVGFIYVFLVCFFFSLICVFSLFCVLCFRSVVLFFSLLAKRDWQDRNDPFCVKWDVKKVNLHVRFSCRFEHGTPTCWGHHCSCAAAGNFVHSRPTFDWTTATMARHCPLHGRSLTSSSVFQSTEMWRRCSASRRDSGKLHTSCASAADFMIRDTMQCHVLICPKADIKLADCMEP